MNSLEKLKAEYPEQAADIQAGADKERARIMEILHLPEAGCDGDNITPGPRWELAKKLAANPNMTADLAIPILAAMPTAGVSASSEYARHMAKVMASTAADAELSKDQEEDAYLARVRARDPELSVMKLGTHAMANYNNGKGG